MVRRTRSAVAILRPARTLCTPGLRREPPVFTFGPIPAYRGDVKFDADLSRDKRALTLTFSDGATVETGGSGASMAARSFSLILPLEGNGGKAEIEFALHTGVVLQEGTTASVMLSVNGQSMVADFVTDPNQTFVQKLSFAAADPPECRLFAALLVGRDSRHPTAGAQVNFIALDAEILPRPPQPTGRPV
jgi:hypothetical protein